jgi:hypothetical protein
MDRAATLTAPAQALAASRYPTSRADASLYSAGFTGYHNGHRNPHREHSRCWQIWENGWTKAFMKHE